MIRGQGSGVSVAMATTATTIEDPYLKKGHLATVKSAEHLVGAALVSLVPEMREDRVIGYARNVIVETVRGELQHWNCGLFVTSSERKKGIGYALLEDGLAWGRTNGAGVSHISTQELNSARSLYEKAGYRMIETVRSLVLHLRELA